VQAFRPAKQRNGAHDAYERAVDRGHGPSRVTRARAVQRQGYLIGGIGVSGDSSCADHNIAWRARNTLNLDHVPAGVSPDATRNDNIVYDIKLQAGQMPGVSASGWGHPVCSDDATMIAGQPAGHTLGRLLTGLRAQGLRVMHP
jgi:hypothetical protein